MSFSFCFPSPTVTGPGKERRAGTTAPRRPRGALADWLRGSRPGPAPAAVTQGSESRLARFKPATPWSLAGQAGFMAAAAAARPVSRMLRRVLRSTVRSCSSGAPVTLPHPGEPSQPATEVSLPASPPSPGGGGLVNCPLFRKRPGPSGASGTELWVLNWGWLEEWNDVL